MSCLFGCSVQHPQFDNMVCCGALICNECNQNLETRKVPDCPLCRTKIATSPPELVAQLKARISRGDLNAYATLAQIYRDGMGDGRADRIHRDVPKCVRLLEFAAAGGNANAQHALAMQHYEKGFGVEQDTVKADLLLTAAAKQGHVRALLHFGCTNAERGDMGGVYKEHRRHAVIFLRKAAEKGDPDAQHFLATTYERGWATELFSDDTDGGSIEAAWWYRKAAAAMRCYETRCATATSKEFGSEARLAELLPAQRCSACCAPAARGKTLAVCSRCISAVYCNASCQTKHHPAHKKSCKSVRQIRQEIFEAPIPDTPLRPGAALAAFKAGGLAATLIASQQNGKAPIQTEDLRA